MDVRPFTSEEALAASDLLNLLFAESGREEDRHAELSVLEPARTQGAFEDGTMVGCLACYSHDLSIPGGSIPVAGTTWVGVSPTHRRRGVLRAMMTAHLREAMDRGEALAALWASEASIYGRFGFGMAVERDRVEVVIDAGLTWEDTAPPAAESVRLVPVQDAAPVIDPIYEACRARRAGMHRRSPAWWGFQVLSTRKAAREGASGKHVAIATVDGRDAAYAVYGLREGEWVSGRPGGVVTVMELAGVDAAAEAAMWRYVLAHDLVSKVESYRRPVDDALPFLLADSRRVTRRTTDGLYVRILDLPAATRARSYAESAGVTIEVHDPLVPANDGSWHIEVAPEGASVEPARDGTADIAMGIRAFGALYLGSIGIQRLVGAGMVTVNNPSILPSLDAAFRTLEAAWAPEVW